MSENIIEKIDRFVEDNMPGVLRDIAELVSIDSVARSSGPEGMPFGEGCAAALEKGLEISERLGLQAENCEGYIGYAQVGEGGRDCKNYLATVTHLDVVPCGDEWTHDPFAMLEKEGYIIGRGVMDDKGPSVLCLYALKYLKENCPQLHYPVRALLGTCEETDMADVIYYLNNYPAPLFCFSPDADFPMCNGEKGIFRGNLISYCRPENVVQIKGGLVANAVPDKAEALVKAENLVSTQSVTAEKEGEFWHLTAKGIGGHASLPEGTVNAIGALLKYILDNGIASEEEKKYFEACMLIHEDYTGAAAGIAASDNIFKPLTAVSGLIGIEDGHFFQSLDCRYPTTTSGENICRLLEEKVGDVLHAEIYHDNPPFYMSLDKPEVQACLEAYNEVTGENAEPYTIGGGTYARDFPNAVSFGPEHPERPQPEWAGPIHGVDEAASIEFFREALKIYILALLKLEELDF